MGESYYELLGVDPDATAEEIQQAYRETLKETHPDVSDEADASERTKRLIEARDVLTDEAERARYDRLGHEAYVDAEQSPADSTAGTASGEADRTDPAGSGRGSTGPSSSGGASTSSTESATPGGGAATAGGSGSGAASETVSGASTASGSANASSAGGTASGTDTRQRNRGGRVREDSMYDSTPGEGGSDGSDNWQVWDTDGSFAVNRDGDRYKHGRMFASQRALILLCVTFVVYPVLLFGALLPQFPLVINLTVAMCVILVIAFLQSVPEVGIAVFGIWSVLLPLAMFWTGIELLSVRAFFVMVAVVFPLGLSLLTRVAIRPVSAG